MVVLVLIPLEAIPVTVLRVTKEITVRKVRLVLSHWHKEIATVLSDNVLNLSS